MSTSLGWGQAVFGETTRLVATFGDTMRLVARTSMATPFFGDPLVSLDQAEMVSDENIDSNQVWK